MPCYELCDCECFDEAKQFDSVRIAETRFSPSLYDVCHSNIGWYSDKSISDAHLGEWGLANAFGIYILWHKDDYCSEHELFHMRALYVGKGEVKNRLYDHYRSKDFSEQLLVYWTYLEMPNRVAKYYEQLTLDTFRIPMNKREARGEALLCTHFTQAEVD